LEAAVAPQGKGIAVKIRIGLAAVAAAAGAALVMGAAPAFASGPPVPAGCTFDQATGVETCVTTTSTSTNIWINTDGDLIPASTRVYDGITGAQICTELGYGSGASEVGFYNAVFVDTTTTTTTSERHGLNGRVFNTSTSASQSFTGVVSGSLGCAYS